MLARGNERGEKEESDAAVQGEDPGVWRWVVRAKPQPSWPRETRRHNPISAAPEQDGTAAGREAARQARRQREDVGQELLLSEARREALWLREWHCCHQRALAGTADNNPGRGELQDPGQAKSP